MRDKSIEIKDLIDLVKREIRLKPKEDAGDAEVLEKLLEYLNSERDKMFFDFHAARQAIGEWQRPSDLFGRVRFVDLKPTLERCWRHNVNLFRPRNYFDPQGHAIGVRRCAACRGRGYRMSCSHIGWWGHRRCEDCRGECGVCRFCSGGGYAHEEANNEDADFISRERNLELARDIKNLCYKSLQDREDFE